MPSALAAASCSAMSSTAFAGAFPETSRSMKRPASAREVSPSASSGGIKRSRSAAMIFA
jgi:hypothetical protein